MSAKLSFAEVSAIKRMNQKQLTALVQEIYHNGWEECEQALETATHEQWLEMVNSSPDVRDNFAIWDYDKLYNRLSKDFTRANVERIMEIITEVIK